MLDEEGKQYIQGDPRLGTKAHLWVNKKNKTIVQTWLPQHLSLGTKEQRRAQDPDAGG
jgi:hypothetical protein